MIVSDIKYTITIVAVKGDSRNFVIELQEPGRQDRHYTVGKNNSVSNTVARIIRKIETNVPTEQGRE